MRTGFSEAWLTDLDNDSYDLTWYSELPEPRSAGDPSVAGYWLQIRTLSIATSSSPSSSGGSIGAARSKTMGWLSSMRSVSSMTPRWTAFERRLHAKFAKVPFLETYEQMAIRQQKVKYWAACRSWAARGVQPYGDDAADAMWVDDLEKRLDPAQAKLDEPKAARHSADSVVRIRAAAGQSDTADHGADRDRSADLHPLCNRV